MNDQFQKVFIVQHEYERNGCDHFKHIGVFFNRDEAETAVDKLRNLPGFKSWPNGFEISEVIVGEYGWKEGFGASGKLLDLLDDTE
jgi:hypothetical protein